MSRCREWTCAAAGCQNVIRLHHATEQKLRETHESFYCPAGHSNYFPGKTDEEKKIDRLNTTIVRMEQRALRFRGLWEEALEQREDWKLQAKSCPFECGYRVVRKSKPENISIALAMHLVEAHGAVLPVAEEALA